jgi:type I restriction-modification system DNA methylase subunit
MLDAKKFLFDFKLNSFKLAHPNGLSVLDINRDKTNPFNIPALEKIIKLIDSAACKFDKNKLVGDIFECGAVAISNQVDFTQYDVREKKYKEIISFYGQKERELIAEIFGNIYALLSSVVYEDGKFDDYLGKLFMTSNLGDPRKSQFFTPYHVSVLCAKMSMDGDVVREKQDNNGILMVYEPCCGSGGMVLASIDILKNDYDFNYARNCFVVCEDIDIRCVHMCYLQLALAGVPAVVKHRNTLSRETWSVWRTPAYMLQYVRFREFED